MGKTNKYLDLWRKIVMDHKRKHGGTLKESMQNKSVKAEYARRKKSLGGGSPRKTSPTKRSPRRKTSKKPSKKPSPTKRSSRRKTGRNTSPMRK
mgnify:CR=1 FL=1